MRWRGCMKRIVPTLLAAASLAACAAENDPSCAAVTAQLAACTDQVPEGFAASCQADPADAQQIADAVCADGKGDGAFGWRVEGEQCFNFNFECKSGLICAPIDASEEVQVCMKPRTEPRAYCDDDADCAGSMVCFGDEVRWIDLGTFVWPEMRVGRCHEFGGNGASCILFDFECQDGLRCRYPNKETDEPQISKICRVWRSMP